jgi:hypothetical protein
MYHIENIPLHSSIPSSVQLNQLESKFQLLFCVNVALLQLAEQAGTQFTSIMQHIQDRVPSTKNNEDSDLFCLDQLSHYANILTPTTSPKVRFIDPFHVL